MENVRLTNEEIFEIIDSEVDDMMNEKIDDDMNEEEKKEMMALVEIYRVHLKEDCDWNEFQNAIIEREHHTEEEIAEIRENNIFNRNNDIDVRLDWIGKPNRDDIERELKDYIESEWFEFNEEIESKDIEYFEQFIGI